MIHLHDHCIITAAQSVAMMCVVCADHNTSMLYPRRSWSIIFIRCMLAVSHPSRTQTALTPTKMGFGICRVTPNKSLRARAIMSRMCLAEVVPFVRSRLLCNIDLLIQSVNPLQRKEACTCNNSNMLLVRQCKQKSDCSTFTIMSMSARETNALR